MTARTNTLLRPTMPARRRIGFLTKVVKTLELFRERRRLAELPDHILNDIGVTRDQATAEARREIWDAPSHWQR